jgi:valyl-tRNA synthetase
MASYFQRMASATAAGLGPSVVPPAVNAAISVSGMEIFINLAGVIDIQAEIARNVKEEQKLLSQIQGREAKLSNRGFLEKAPEHVVAAERDALAKLQEQLTTVQSALAALRRSGDKTPV